MTVHNSDLQLRQKWGDKFNPLTYFLLRVLLKIIITQVILLALTVQSLSRKQHVPRMILLYRIIQLSENTRRW